MNAYFPIAIIQLTGGKGIIEVLGIFRVDRKSRDTAKILTFGNFLFRDRFRYLFCCLLDVGRILVWKVKLGQDSIHLRIVVAGSTQNIDYFAQRVLGSFRPFGDTYDRFVAGLAPFQFVFRNKNIVCKSLVFRNKKCEPFGHLQFSGDRALLAFQYFNNLAFRVSSFSFGMKLNFYLIAVKRMCGVSLCHENRSPAIFGDKRVLAILAAHKSSDSSRSPIVIAVASPVYLGNEIVGRKLIQDIHHLQLLHLIGYSNHTADLSIVKRFFGRRFENVDDGIDHSLFFHPFVFTFGVAFLLPRFITFLFRFILSHIPFQCFTK